MKIVLLPSAYAPAVGGVEHLTARLAHHLSGRGHEVEIWTARIDSWPDEEVVDGLTVRRFRFWLPGASADAMIFPARAAATLAKLTAAAQRFRPDVLHVQCFSGNGVYAAGVSAIRRTPFVVTLQGETVMDDHDVYDRSWTLRTCLPVALKRADAITGCSRFVLRDAEERFGLGGSRGRVVPNGIDVDEVEPARGPLPFSRYVLALGRVVRKKGFDLLLEAFALLAGDRPDVGLVIGGSGAELSPLRLRVQELSLEDRVHFPGSLDRAQVAGLVERAEIFVLPSRVEPFGIVALEAWRAGTPLIVTPYGGTVEFVEDGISGLVADPNDAGCLAAMMRRLLDSPELRTRLAGGGRRRLDEFSWRRITGQYEAIYRTVVPAATRRRRGEDAAHR